MNFSNLILMALVAGACNLANADIIQGKLVAVADLRVDLVTGCGVPDPGTGTCNLPDQTTVSFTVPYGGSCHTYHAVASRSGKTNMLSVYDVAMANCTRPEEKDFPVSIDLKGRFKKGEIKLANPLYVRTHIRP